MVLAAPANLSARSPARTPLLLGAGAAALAGALLLRDPHHSGSWGYCPFLLVTGHPCPACGGLRATHDLLTGDWAAALSSNAYVVLTVVVAATGYAAWLAAALRGRRPSWARHLPTLVAWWGIGLAVFGVARYLPALSALRP
ncbi:MAG TPA: DUF2752 domain-containing protein [Pedococcus sp.]